MATYVDVITSGFGDVRNSSFRFGWKHEFMFDEGIFIYISIYIASCDMTADFHVLREEVPLEITTQGWSIHSFWNVNRVSQHVNVSQGPLDAVEDSSHYAGTQFYR